MTKNLTIITNPDSRLRQRSKNVKPEDISDLADFAKAMIETMLNSDGVGLAAPQVGKNIRLIIVNSQAGPQIIFNPEINKKSLLKVWGEEGCLSVPNTFGDVKRHKKIQCSFMDLTGKSRSIEAVGLMARVIQHEIDHLDGILFIDKAKKIHMVENL
jgi:peptide deformylase